MKVTIPQALREMLLETTAPAYCHPLGAIYPQAAYVTLDLRDGALGISTALPGGSQRMDEDDDRLRRFPISPYAHGPDLLNRLEEMVPELQAYADLFVTRWNGSIMRFSPREDLARAFHEQRCEHLVDQLEDIPEVAILTPDWYNPLDFLRETPTASPREIAREIVEMFQGEHPLHSCDVDEAEQDVLDALERRIDKHAEDAHIIFDKRGVILKLGDHHNHLYDSPQTAAQDYLRYIIDGGTDRCAPHEEGLDVASSPGSQWFRGDGAEDVALRPNWLDCVSTHNAAEFFRILRHARGVEVDRRCASARVDRGER